MREAYRDYGAILPCGGRGSRLAPLSGDVIPKSLFPVGGQELIKYSTDVLTPDLVRRLVFAVDHRADQIRSWVEKQHFPHIVNFSEQLEPGVLGAITAGATYVQEEAIVACNTDEVRSGLDLADILSFHENHGAIATMVVTFSDHLARHRHVQTRERDNLVIATRLKPEEYRNTPTALGLINTGFLVMERVAVEHFDATYSRDWGGIIDPLCDAGQVVAYVDQNIHYFNVGTPDEYREADIFIAGQQNSGTPGI